VKSVFPLWYSKMAMSSSNEFWARSQINNWGSGAQIVISVVYIGQQKDWAKGLLDQVNAEACGGYKGSLSKDIPNDSWINIVLRSNGLNDKSQLLGNNCGWNLAGSKPTHTNCNGFDTEYNVDWAYRSLVMGKGGRVPQGVWDSLAQQKYYNMFYVELDPTNGATADIAVNATAYPHRDKGFITMQQVMRGQSNAPPLSDQMSMSLSMMKSLTSYVPALGYYNYLDKGMNEYNAVPRDAYYGPNADRVLQYTKQYTEGLGLANGCDRCRSWEIRPQK